MKPTIVCLCGSSKFKDKFVEINLQQTLAGKIVLSLGGSGHVDANFTKDEKAKIDELHLRKIDLADEVFVIDVGGYIGHSTRNELTYAQQQGKRITFYSSIYETPPEEGAITDGFGNYYSSVCPECGGETMQIIRPGKAQCSECE